MAESENVGSMVRELDTSDKLRKAAAIQVASYQSRLANSYNKRVKPWVFQPGDLVLRKVFENTADPTTGKFQPNWEGVVCSHTARGFRVLCYRQNKWNSCT